MEKNNPKSCYTFKFSKGSIFRTFVLFLLSGIGIYHFFINVGIKSLNEPGLVMGAICLIMGIWALSDLCSNRYRDFIKLTTEGIEIDQSNELEYKRVKAHFSWTQIGHLDVTPAKLKHSYNMNLYDRQGDLLGSYSVAEKVCVEDPTIDIETAYYKIKNSRSI